MEGPPAWQRKAAPGAELRLRQANKAWSAQGRPRSRQRRDLPSGGQVFLHTFCAQKVGEEVFYVLFVLTQKGPKKSRLGPSRTHHGLDPGAGQTRLRHSGGSNKAWRYSGPAAGGYPRCGAEADPFRWEESPPCGNWRIILLLSPMLDGGTARLAAKGGAGRGSAFAAGKQSMERLRASAVTPAA